MGRLERHNQKKIAQRILFFGALALILLVFFFSSGLQLIINTTLFINQIANPTKNTATAQKNNDGLSSVILDPPASATNSATIQITGTLYNFDMLEIYVNSEKVAEKNIAYDSFSYDVPGLIKGDNSIYVIAKSSKSKETKKSQKFNVTYRNEKPKLEISEPHDNATVHSNEITIKGTTDKETSIRVNDRPVVVDVQGTFQTSLRLNEGDNSVEVVAEDMVGNTETKKLTVKYVKED